ncbi:glutathione S-transferase [Parazoarcus communis]|uniref:Glutathione S-transferase n=1 Tax=Parazoarcus communis SWub3 = DSM 12120 TaxID=1121029 RepID=A0A323UPW8_9RHOO|nr:glutathione S-transferase [Parazoarcus communis]NMG72092.1 glutathione S-transferase [Parazoarcus communis SWub3 = DSM 12120]PZA14534.1 glutathione S-transferase [Azoarcus communis] [Parazoarcus communis SWub3 = DSM 12120]
MKLLASLTSPYARKIRILLAEKHLPFELVVDSPWESATRVPEVNPLGKVPALVLDSGEVFFDSPVIAGYLETLEAQPALLPPGGIERVRVRQTEALADGILDAAVSAFLESRRPEAQQSTVSIARQHDKIRRSLDELEKRVTGRDWLDGNTMLLGDITVAIALDYLDLRLPQTDWRTGRPALTALHERLASRPSFVDTVPPAG